MHSALNQKTKFLIKRRTKLNKIYKTAIIGGGASGLMTAVELLRGENAFCGQDLLILERNDRVGKKLIATGNGQGNLMNENFSSINYRGKKSFIDSFVASAKKIDLESYLFELGIPLFTGKDGKKYPLSRQASAVLDIIRAYLITNGVNIVTNAFVLDVKKEKGTFKLKSSSGEYLSKTVVMATGGCSARQFGTDGSSYVLAENFNHRKTPLYPSLVQLKTDTKSIKGLKGLKEIARVTAYSGNNSMTAEGDILFTDYGVSGNTMFQVSAILNGKKGEYLQVEFLPHLSIEQTEDIINKRCGMEHINKEDVLCGILNKRIGQAVMRTARGNNAKDIAYAIKNFRLDVMGNMGFNYSQVTKGGIDTEDINPITMQSKLVKDFYIVGETLDVDGDCGGYNVTFAFVSGIISAKSIKNNGEDKCVD